MGSRIVVTVGLAGLVGFFGCESLEAQDARVTSIEAARVRDFPEIKDLPSSDREVLKITFASGRDFQSYAAKHGTTINVDAYPCSWASRDEGNDRLGLSYFLYDQFGEVSYDTDRGRHLASKPEGSSLAVYHFYASLLPWNVRSRSYDLINKPEDLCFSVFFASNLLGAAGDRHDGGLVLPSSSDVVVVPQSQVASAISSAHLQ